MRCNHCNARLGNHDLWCVSCGKQSSVIPTELSSMKSLSNTWKNYKENSTKNIPAAGLSVLLGMIPIVLLTFLWGGLLNIDSETALHLLLQIGSKVLAYSIFVPFIFIGLAAISNRQDYEYSLPMLKDAFKRYHAYFALALISAVYYTLIYLICFGFPGFGSDPILRLVWIVLVNYWWAIILPVPVIAETQKVSMIKALSLSYRHFHDLRWNLYLLALVLVIINFLALVFFVVGLAFSLPLSIFAIRDYTQKLIDYRLLDYRR